MIIIDENTSITKDQLAEIFKPIKLPSGCRVIMLNEYIVLKREPCRICNFYGDLIVYKGKTRCSNCDDKGYLEFKQDLKKLELDRR